MEEERKQKLKGFHCWLQGVTWGLIVGCVVKHAPDAVLAALMMQWAVISTAYYFCFKRYLE